MSDRVLARLHAGMRERRTPQAVAVDLVAMGAHEWLDGGGARELHGVARAACGRRSHATGSSMRSTWRHHPGVARAYAAAAAAMRVVAAAARREVLADADATDPRSLSGWLDGALGVLGLPRDEVTEARQNRASPTVKVTYGGWTYSRRRKPCGRRGDTGGHVDARRRMDADTRRVELPGVSVRAYRRAVRAVLHLQQRTAVLAVERDREAATAFGKARFGYTVPLDAFVACPRTAAFVAYYVARLGMRTLFTSGPQARPMDTVAEALLQAALAAPTCRPDVLATVVTRQRVLDRLDDGQCGELLGKYYEQLAACARALRASFDPHRDRTQMVVRRGDDSSTWNIASRAFNQARTGWLNLTAALGYDDLVEASCPGKVPALIASDVAFWHMSEGGDQHVDTRVWAELPLPWEVVLDGAACPADAVRAACRVHGIDADKTGWTQPYRQDQLARAEPAPDLVHGVVVTSPLLAGLLRDAGVYSGRLPTDRQRRSFDGLLGRAGRGPG